MADCSYKGPQCFQQINSTRDDITKFSNSQKLTYIVIVSGCYGRVAPRSGLTVKHFIDIGENIRLRIKNIRYQNESSYY